jgi:hypothetical protein
MAVTCSIRLPAAGNSELAALTGQLQLSVLHLDQPGLVDAFTAI